MVEPIKAVLLHYFPEWEPPEDTGSDWIKCFCPSHDESIPSASVSFLRNAVNCHACGFSGDYLSIIKDKEGCDYGTAVRVAERIFEESNVEVPPELQRKPRRRISRPKRFGER